MWFPKKRKCKENFVAQLSLMRCRSWMLLGNSGQMHIAIVLWPNIENLLYLDL